MKIRSTFAIVLFSAVSVVSGQDPHGLENRPPRSQPWNVCRLDKARGTLMLVKESPLNLDLSLSLDEDIHFPVGTVVIVNKRQQSWSCVTGSIQMPEGWKSRTGWMESSFLEPIPRSM